MKEDIQLIEKVRLLAKNFFDGSRGSHDWDHTLRVCKLCKRIGSVQKNDMTVLLSAAYLHDIGRHKQDQENGAVCHAQQGAQMAIDILADFPFSQKQKENIVHSIRSHRYRGEEIPETREAQVLFDADKLDAIGAVGIARAYLFAGEVGATLHNPGIKAEDTHPYSKDDTGYREYVVKLCKIKDRMLTPEGRRIAESRHLFMEQFFHRFMLEYEGLDD